MSMFYIVPVILLCIFLVVDIWFHSGDITYGDVLISLALSLVPIINIIFLFMILVAWSDTSKFAKKTIGKSPE